MTPEEQRSTYTPFDQLTDEELREAMVMHIRMGYIMKNPGKSREAETAARDIVNRLSLEQLKEIHPHTFFANKKMGDAPKNPYSVALEMLEDK
ncbi:MAG: hypothetical protein V1862_08000 [Methanobacteriota archaeon]